MRPSEHFLHCPRCGQKQAQASNGQVFRCEHCAFVYYFNPAIAAAAFIVKADGQVLFIRRAKDPAKGKLAIPGGFIDVGERAETALRREVKEEVGLDLAGVEYLCSHENAYDYKGVTYPVLDLFFVGEAGAASVPVALDGVESYSWRNPTQVDPEDIAFASIRYALGLYLARTAVK